MAAVGTRTEAKPRKRQHALPIEAWPPADRKAWLAATRPGRNILDDGGVASHLAPVTVADYTSRYAYFLDFIRNTGRLVHDAPPGASVTRETVRAYLKYLDDRVASVTQAGSIQKILKVAEWIEPARDWSWLRRVANRLATRAVPKNKRPRVVEADRLYDLGLTLMTRAEAEPGYTAYGRAELYRDGLMVALLAACPLRRGNFTALRIGDTLLRSQSRWMICIPDAEIKTGRPIEMPVPPTLGRKLDWFLAHHRVAFKGAEGHNHLWPSRNGGPLSDSSVFNVIVRRTRDAFGHSVNPHLFRDSIVTTIATHHGAHIAVASSLLGHVDPRVTERHYNQAGMIDAVRAYQDVVMGSGA